MAQVTTTKQPQLPAVFAKTFGEYDAGEFTEGAGASFGVLSIRGKIFRVKRGGEEEIVADENGDPKGSIHVIILRGSKQLSKLYYEKRYAEGDDSAPDCYSMDSIKPDASSPKLQSKLCASCKQNVFGSAVTDNGSKSKACKDSRRLAVMLIETDPDLVSDPILLRLPVMSLRPLADYANKLKKLGWPMHAIVTRLSFDSSVAYPKVAFRPVSVISDDEQAEKIMALRDDVLIEQILNTPVEAVASDDDTQAESEEEEVAARQMAKAKKPAAFSRAEKPTAEPEPEKEGETALEEAAAADAGKPNVKQEDVGTLFGGEEEQKPTPKANGKVAKAKANAPADEGEHTENTTIEQALDTVFADFD